MNKQTITQDNDVMGSGFHVEGVQSAGEQQEQSCPALHFDNLYFEKWDKRNTKVTACIDISTF